MQVTYKTKSFKNTCGVDCISIKRNWVKTDFTGEHRLLNTTMFPALINRMVKEVTNGREWFPVDNLPHGIQVIETGFLHTVSIILE